MLKLVQVNGLFSAYRQATIRTSIDRTQLRVPTSSARIKQRQTRPKPQPLSNCLNGGTAINDQVLRCRFGEVPHPQADTPFNPGMVSAAYLAKYQTERLTRSSHAAKDQFTGSESHVITGWDGSRAYQATWQVVGNEIDSSSVCLNYRQGSIEFRECRKGAKQWFKEQCRAAKDEVASKAMRSSYCSAASSFSPM